MNPAKRNTGTGPLPSRPNPINTNHRRAPSGRGRPRPEGLILPAPAPAATAEKSSPFQAFLAGGEEPITVSLSGPASALVRWYCGVTKHREEVTVDGVVFGSLTRAKEAHADDSCLDEAFNFVLDDVLEGMNNFRLREHARRGLLSVELDRQASDAVWEYARLTGTDPRDIVNAAVTEGVGTVVSQLAEGEARDDGPYILRDHVAAAARRRTGEDAPNTPVALLDLTPEEKGITTPGVGTPLSEGDRVPKPGKDASSAEAGTATRTVTLEFKPEAFALLEAARVNDGFESVERFLRVNIASTVAGFCESLDAEGLAEDEFAAPQEDGREG